MKKCRFYPWWLLPHPAGIQGDPAVTRPAFHMKVEVAGSSSSWILSAIFILSIGFMKKRSIHWLPYQIDIIKMRCFDFKPQSYDSSGRLIQPSR